MHEPITCVLAVRARLWHLENSSGRPGHAPCSRHKACGMQFVESGINKKKARKAVVG
jgi:hypothetical protein